MLAVGDTVKLLMKGMGNYIGEEGKVEILPLLPGDYITFIPERSYNGSSIVV